jgi:hypothetical protein
MTHALKFQDFMCFFEQQLMKYGGYGKKMALHFSNNQLEKID